MLCWFRDMLPLSPDPDEQRICTSQGGSVETIGQGAPVAALSSPAEPRGGESEYRCWHGQASIYPVMQWLSLARETNHPSDNDDETSTHVSTNLP